MIKLKMSETISSAYIWTVPFFKTKENVFNYVQTVESTNEETIILRCNHVEGFDDILPVTTYIFDLCQKFKLLKSDRTTFLNYKDHFTAIELCLARQKLRNEASELKITKEEVTKTHNAYLDNFEKVSNNGNASTSVKKYQEFLQQNNCVNLWLLYNYLQTDLAQDNSVLKPHLCSTKFLILGQPLDEIFKKLLISLTVGKELKNIVVETPLDVSLNGSESPIPLSPSSVNVYSETVEFDFILVEPLSNNSSSATKEYVEDVITAFFSLLVNSRNELALCKAMISPIIDLSHAAFTELKHLSIKKEMPMCQTAISYVTKVSLGGKGYAPSEDCPMLPHLKGLEKFVDALNHLQTVIEEYPTSSALRKVTGFLKKKLIKCGEDKLKTESIEAVAENMLHTINKIMSSEKIEDCGTGSQAYENTLTVIQYLVNYVSSDCWSCTPESVFNEREIKRTPLNLPPLLGYFRSPEEESCDEDVVLEESNNSVNDSQPQSISYFHHNSNSAPISCVDSKTPTKVTFKDGLRPTANLNEDEVTVLSVKQVASKKIPQATNNRKRPVLGEITNKSAPKRAANNPKKEVVKKASKTKQQIKGQGKLTGFFIFGK